jgi:hypothetical protein
MMKVISRKLVRKALEMLKSIASASDDDEEEEEEEDANKSSDDSNKEDKTVIFIKLYIFMLAN